MAEMDGHSATARPLQIPPAPALNLRGGGPAFLEAAGRVLGTPLPEANHFREADGRTTIWLGPDEWLVLGRSEDADTMEARLRSQQEGAPSAVTDVTGNRIALRLSGPDARDLLAAGCPLDLHPRSFGPGRCAQTVLARTGVILLQRDEAPTFDVLVRRSFARYLLDWFASVIAVAGRA